MRILAVEPAPNFSVADVHRGWVRGLRDLGAEVVEAQFGQRLEFFVKATEGLEVEDHEAQAMHLANESLRALLYDVWPDVVVITSAFYLNEFTFKILRHRAHKVVLLHTESPYEDDRQIRRAQFADVNIVNDPTNIDRFPPGTEFFPHAYDPAIHHPGPSEHGHDFVMVGTGYPSRVEFLEQVDWPCTPVLCGNWQGVEDDSPLLPHLGHDRSECFPNELAADLYRGSRSSLNLYRREATHTDLVEGWAMGPREVELAACGCFYLTEERGENRDVLPMVPTVDGPADFAEKLGWWLSHDSERERVARLAQEAVHDRTFKANAARLLQIVN